MSTGIATLHGLSEQEAVARRARGEGNQFVLETSRSYRRILRDNAFTFVNTVLFAISVLLLAMGLFGDALVTAGLVLFNVVTGVVQEGRAKRKLDQIALLVRPRAAVIRGGREVTIDPAQVVLGDVLVARPGDQIVVDGTVVGDGRMDVDESLLTGESDPVPKRAGDPVFSGSYCLTGEGAYRAEKVGAESLANRIAAGARTFRRVKTPLQRAVDFILRVALIVAVVVGLQVASALWQADGPVSFRDSVRAAAVIVALVPQGLAFMITVSYALGAVRMAGKGALIQRANAVESLSHVNVLCLDKTGTLTTNRIRMQAVELLALDEPTLRARLGDYVAGASGGNPTTEAIAAAFRGHRRRVREEVAFSSVRKWSAVAFDDPEVQGVYVLGAPEVLEPYLDPDARRSTRSGGWTEQGLRVLLFAYTPEVTALHDPSGEPRLPHGLIPAAALSLRDELRPEAKRTLQAFAETGISLKIISGDNPQTVAALARQAGLSEETTAVSGLDLAAMDDAAFQAAVQSAGVFGRITPQQKERLVRTLRSQGKYVAMIGDGVNDVLALKQAHLGIAMQSGSQATRGAADVVLLNDSFGALPAAFREGQRIIRGMRDVIRLFLVRTLYVTLVILGVAIVGAEFPVTPKQNSVLALLTVGIPTLGLAAWARPGQPPPSMVRSISRFVFPAALTIMAITLPLYLVYLWLTDDVTQAQTVLTVTAVVAGLLLIPFVEPPTRAWAAAETLSGDARPALMAIAMFALFTVVLTLERTRDFFELVPLHWYDYALIGIVVFAWARALRWIWRAGIFERFMGLDQD